jgi:hypothetical protein
MCGDGRGTPRYERGKHSVYHAFRVAPPTRIGIPGTAEFYLTPASFFAKSAAEAASGA